jgi:hypothetical protein
LPTIGDWWTTIICDWVWINWSPKKRMNSYDWVCSSLPCMGMIDCLPKKDNILIHHPTCGLLPLMWWIWKLIIIFYFAQNQRK